MNNFRTNYLRRGDIFARSISSRVFCGRVARRLAVVAGVAAFALTCTALPLADPDSEMILGTMQQELTRAQTSLGKSDPAPYYISYAVFDHENVSINASEGSLM